MQGEGGGGCSLSSLTIKLHTRGEGRDINPFPKYEHFIKFMKRAFGKGGPRSRPLLSVDSLRDGCQQVTGEGRELLEANECIG